MANEVLFLGGRLESVEVSGSVNELTTSAYIDTSYVDASINPLSQVAFFAHNLFTQSGGVLSPDTVVSGETLFAHHEAYNRVSPSGDLGPGVEILDSFGHPWIKLQNNSSNLIGLHYNSGTGASPVWTLLGSRQAFAQSTKHIVDIEVTIGTPHTAKLYLNNNLLVNATFTQALFTNMARVTYGSNSRFISSITTPYSQVLVTRGISTIGAKVKYSRATGAGANTDWSGSYASVNEAINSDATLQNAPTAGLKSTHVVDNVSVPSGFEIKSIFHWLRAKNDGTGPTKIKSILRQSGVDYATADLTNIGLGYGPIGARYDADPIGTNWTEATWNNIEAGYEAAT